MEEKLFKEFDKVSRAEWQAKITTDLKGKPYESLLWQAAGLKGEPVYTHEDLPETLTNLANGHENPEIFGARHWVNYQLIVVKDEQTANKKTLHALDNGAEGILYVLSKKPDWSQLLKDIQLAYCHIGLDDRSTETDLLSSYIAYGKSQVSETNQLHGFYKGQVSLGSFNELDGFKCIHLQASEEISSQVPAIQLAYVLSTAAGRFDQLTEAGHTPEQLFKQAQIQLTTGSSYFAEVAKYRAMRGLTIRFAIAYGLTLTPSEIEIVAQSSDWSADLDDPHSHMLSATTQAMSAIIGGADALCIQPFYPVFKQNEALAERAARNISSILREESYLNKVIDPSAGTYYLESLTHQLIEESWELFLLFEKAGGASAISAATAQSLHQKNTA